MEPDNLRYTSEPKPQHWHNIDEEVGVENMMRRRRMSQPVVEELQTIISNPIGQRDV